MMITIIMMMMTFMTMLLIMIMFQLTGEYEGAKLL